MCRMGDEKGKERCPLSVAKGHANPKATIRTLEFLEVREQVDLGLGPQPQQHIDLGSKTHRARRF